MLFIYGLANEESGAHFNFLGLGLSNRKQWFITLCMFTVLR